MIIGITDEHIGDDDITSEQLGQFVEALNESMRRHGLDIEAVAGDRGPWGWLDDAPLDGNHAFDAAWDEALSRGLGHEQCDQHAETSYCDICDQDRDVSAMVDGVCFQCWVDASEGDDEELRGHAIAVLARYWAVAR